MFSQIKVMHSEKEKKSAKACVQNISVSKNPPNTYTITSKPLPV
jgi:hypothetical protein